MLIGQTLPFAASAHAVMLAERLCPLRRIFIELYSLSLGIAMFLSPDLKVNHIARHHVRHKHDKVINPGESLSFGRHTGYRNLLKQRQLFLFSCHYIRLFIVPGSDTQQQTALAHTAANYKFPAKIHLKSR